MKHPLYLLWILLVTGSLATANLRGWSFMHTLSPLRLIRSGPGLSHK